MNRKERAIKYFKDSGLSDDEILGLMLKLIVTWRWLDDQDKE